MRFDELVIAASKKICEMNGRDPEERIAVEPHAQAVVDANGKAYVPLWETVTPEVGNHLMIAEGVRLAIVENRAAQAPEMTQ